MKTIREMIRTALAGGEAQKAVRPPTGEAPRKAPPGACVVESSSVDLDTRARIIWRPNQVSITSSQPTLTRNGASRDEQSDVTPKKS